MSHLLCFGLGYSARVLCRALARDGWRISGTSRTDSGAAALAADGWVGLTFDGHTAAREVRDELRTATQVLLSIPPDADGDCALRVFADALAEAPQVRWIGYLSTVGVYGDQSGGWVDETTPAVPGSERGRRRLAAETAWMAFGAACIKPVQVFRLPGIYGPGRSTIDSLRAGTARRIIKPNQYFNRVHVDDIAQAVVAAMLVPQPHQIFNVTDDRPSPPQDVVTYAASLIGVAPPPEQPFETANLTPMARSFYGESKRVSNARMKVALGVRLAFPTYREGLADIASR